MTGYPTTFFKNLNAQELKVYTNDVKRLFGGMTPLEKYNVLAEFTPTGGTFLNYLTMARDIIYRDNGTLPPPVLGEGVSPTDIHDYYDVQLQRNAVKAAWFGIIKNKGDIIEGYTEEQRKWMRETFVPRKPYAVDMWIKEQHGILPVEPLIKPQVPNDGSGGFTIFFCIMFCMAMLAARGTY